MFFCQLLRRRSLQPKQRNYPPPHPFKHIYTKSNTDGASIQQNNPGGNITDLKPAWTVWIWKISLML